MGLFVVSCNEFVVCVHFFPSLYVVDELRSVHFFFCFRYVWMGCVAGGVRLLFGVLSEISKVITYSTGASTPDMVLS